jgi:hypothetical protein
VDKEALGKVFLWVTSVFPCQYIPSTMHISPMQFYLILKIKS